MTARLRPAAAVAAVLMAALLGACTSGVYAETQIPTATPSVTAAPSPSPSGSTTTTPAACDNATQSYNPLPSLTGDAANCGFLHSDKVLKLTGAKPPAKRGQGTEPTVDRNGWSMMKLLENAWSPFDLKLKAVPMSANAARLTVSPMMGMRYSKLPSICVSPPTDVNERGNAAMLLPLEPVKTPRAAADCGKPGTGVGVPSGFDATTTF